MCGEEEKTKMRRSTVKIDVVLKLCWYFLSQTRNIYNAMIYNYKMKGSNNKVWLNRCFWFGTS